MYPRMRRLQCWQQPEIYRVLISTNCGGWLCNRCASMHPASDVRYFVIMSRAMFIAILNGRRGGDLARISRDTRLLRCAFRNTPGKKHYCLFSRSFFFSSVMWASFQEASRYRKLLETRFSYETHNQHSWPLINMHCCI